MIEYTLLCPFGGLGAGALGFIRAETRIFQTKARFRLLGGVDVEPEACADFEYLTGVPELCADIWDLTPEAVRATFGARAPDVVFLSPPCLPGRETVITPFGERHIEEMRVGDTVLTHRGRFQPIAKVGTYLYEGDIFGFRLHGTVDVREFTGEHPLWVRRPYRPVVNGKQIRGRMRGPAFVPAKDVRIGDRIGFPVEPETVCCAEDFINSFGDPRLVVRGAGHDDARPYSKSKHVATVDRIVDLRHRSTSDALWFLLGVYVGDGYRRAERNEVIFCVGAATSELAGQVAEALGALGLTFWEDREGGATNVRLRVTAKHLSMIAGAFGDGCDRKDIPPAIMGLERPQLDALILGLRASDGSERAERRNADGKLFSANWKVVSTSLPLLRSVQRLLLRCGEFGAIHKAWPGGPQNDHGPRRADAAALGDQGV